MTMRKETGQEIQMQVRIYAVYVVGSGGDEGMRELTTQTSTSELGKY